MKFELDSIRRYTQPEPLSPGEARRAVREASTMLIDGGLENRSLSQYASNIAQLMATVTRVLCARNEEPDIGDAIIGINYLITEARNRLDTALMTNDPKTISEASVMCEVVCRGACACFGIQYDEAFLAFLGGHPPLAA